MKKLKYFLLALLLILVVDELIGVARAVLPVFWTSSTGFQARGPVTFAQLASTYDSANNPSGVPQTDGTSGYCSDCKVGIANNVCAGGGAGSPFERVNGVWICGAINAGMIGSVPDPLNVNTINGIGVLPSINNFSLNGNLNVMTYPGADACAKFNAAIMAAEGNTTTGLGSTNLIWTPGYYDVNTTCNWASLASNGQTEGMGNIDVWAYGVVLEPHGIKEAFQFNTGGNQAKSTLHGLRINVIDSTLTAAFHIGRCYNCAAEDIGVYNMTTTPNGLSDAIDIGNRDHGDLGTATQAFSLERPMITGTKYGNSTAPGTLIHEGIQIFGPSANIRIHGGQILACDYSIVLRDDPAGNTNCTGYQTPYTCCTGPNAGTCNNGLMPNKVTIEGVDIEASTFAAINMGSSIDATTGPEWCGYRFLNNTFEQHAVIFQWGGFPSNYPCVQPPLAQGNVVLADNSQYIVNPHNMPMDIQDFAWEGPSGFAGRQMDGGLTVDGLSLNSTTQGLQGTINVTQLGTSTPPVLACFSQCTVSGGETCTTQRCYRAAPMDAFGKIGTAPAETCTPNGPNTLNSTNYMWCRVNPQLTGTQPAGWRFYGRASGAEQFMFVGGKVINGIGASVLNTDSGQLNLPTVAAPGHSAVGPEFKDDGSLTPAGAVPATDTTGVFMLSPASLQFGAPAAAPGGGAAATNATIGGTGPATAAQNGWAKVLLSDGSSAWLPVWK